MDEELENETARYETREDPEAHEDGGGHPELRGADHGSSEQGPREHRGKQYGRDVRHGHRIAPTTPR